VVDIESAFGRHRHLFSTEFYRDKAAGIRVPLEKIKNLNGSFYNYSMKISARNQLRGTVETVDLGVFTAKGGVRVGENLIESVITKQSVEDLNIKVESEVTAIIKSTEVMLMVD
jgi:molybdopterin-binding protein